MNSTKHKVQRINLGNDTQSRFSFAVMIEEVVVIIVFNKICSKNDD